MIKFFLNGNYAHAVCDNCETTVVSIDGFSDQKVIMKTLVAYLEQHREECFYVEDPEDCGSKECDGTCDDCMQYPDGEPEIL